MMNFQLLPSIDPIRLLVAIKSNPELWKEDTYLRDYPQGPFGEIESIMLRFPEKRVFELQEEVEAYKRGEHFFDQHECIDYPAYSILSEARNLVMALMAYVQGERLGRVMINKIAPGGRIYPHADTPEHTDYYTRFHIVLQSGAGCFIRAGDEQLEMRGGDVFWFNNKLEHEVVNNSNTDRISMVVDIKVRK
ncbi:MULTISPECIES: aspartyl/asparaginyl beta-hydroxylase domain-containing protein [Acinetobacter calcoaceticus/baumannii complex]|uniref:aspartyl/asparaginyl beta-hydroxylase domain-containing protein n=1 Tax=Acinetobacter calcoaceticus/baumannii complex TaxID=909768 RepID=UPI0038912300